MGVGLITENLPCEWPTVYGYLSLPRRNPARHAALAEALAEYCRQHELTLGSVFTECDFTCEARTPSFIGLLDVLSMVGTYGVVVPSVQHLGQGKTLRIRRHQVTQTGSRLLIIRATTTASAARAVADRLAPNGYCQATGYPREIRGR